VPGGTLNRRTFESLALAGAFDCFKDLQREDFFEKNNKEESMSEVLLRYGQKYQGNQQDQTASLFGFDDENLKTDSRPEIKHAVPWVDAVRLEKERELVGMYLSAHPLDPYYMELTYGCNSNIKEKSEMMPTEEKEISFGGMVVSFTVKPAKNGGNFGILKMEDATGSTELMLFGKDFIEFAKYGQPGTPIMVTGRFAKRYNSSELRFNITNIKLLEEIKGTVISGITIKVTKDILNDTFNSMLREHINSTNSDLGTLNFSIFDPEINRSIYMRSAVRIPVNRTLINMLNDMNIEYDVERAS
jgi:DNA polymerase-3 subunit alpha